MTSNVCAITNTINTNYPIPNLTNNSQGFRDNWAAIKTALTTACNEITTLQLNPGNTGPTGPNGGPTGPTGPHSVITGPIGPTGPNIVNLLSSLELQWTTSTNLTVMNGTSWFLFNPPYDGFVDSLIYFTGNGSFNVSIAISGASIPGLENISVSNLSPIIINATANNMFSSGEAITAVITESSGNPTDVLLSLSILYTI